MHTALASSTSRHRNLPAHFGLRSVPDVDFERLRSGRYLWLLGAGGKFAPDDTWGVVSHARLNPDAGSDTEWAHCGALSAYRAGSPDISRLAVFLVDTGARIGEAIDLRWNDISGHRVTFWVTKSGRSRTVPMTSRAQKALKTLKSSSTGPFSMLDQVKFRSIWNEAKAQIGLGTDKQVVPHILRHTCASRLVRGGVDLRRVQMWLGHQTLQMTMRYAHLATHDLDGCVKVLEHCQDPQIAQSQP